VAIGSTDRLLRDTRRRLVAMTMGLLALLVVGVGAATAVAGLSTLDADVDQALTATVEAQAAALGGELPSGSEGHEADEVVPAAADTFILVLDASGNVVQNRSGIGLDGLPVLDALGPASTAGRDLRTVSVAGVNVRLLTVLLAGEGRSVGFVQGGFVLTLHDQQSRSLMLTVIAVGVMALVASALIAVVVTGRALRPIRRGIAAQRQFVADASHELRTPAALIRANAEVLEREGLVAADGAPLLADVIAEADRLGGLVGELLQIAAWDETRTALSPATLDLAALAGDTVRGASALAAERGVALRLDAPGRVPVTADHARLVQLLLILVDNALDHAPAGTNVTVRATAEARTAVLEVSDEGPGIPEAELERIFEPFTRVKGTARRGSGGTGLGLAIARRIVDAHGGTIRASSPPGGGAAFTVRLPADAARAPGS
jgi:signal transduction histidine kinase